MEIELLKNTERLYSARSASVADSIAHRDRPSIWLVKAREAFDQASAAARQAGNSEGAQRKDLIVIASAFAEVGEAAVRLGGA